jgi:mersacidin/lichenicidin family type 2 lantibiotic
MSPEDTIRAWKDAKFRQSLGAEERALLPDNPAGFVELSEADLGLVAGAAFTDGCSPFTGDCNTQVQECTGNPILCSADGMCDSEACTLDVCGVTSYSCQSNDVPRCSFFTAC